jgi:hypothetical protein
MLWIWNPEPGTRNPEPEMSQFTVFVNKLTDALGEEHETEVCLDFSRDCGYITPEIHEVLIGKYD